MKSQTVDFSFNTASGFFCNPQTVIFTQTCTGNPSGFIWNFGNGDNGITAVDSTVYNAAGNFTVTLTALYADTAIVTTHTVTINPSPNVSLSSNLGKICTPGTIIFTANASSNVITYEWDYGDASPLESGSSNTLSHTYASFGTFTAHVKAITAFGCTAISSTVIEIIPFTIEGSVTPKKGCIPINVDFTVIPDIPPGDMAQTFLWNFGDGPPVTGTTNSTGHNYNTTATIIPHVTITTAAGCVSDFDFDEVAYGTPPFNTTSGTLSLRDTFCANEFITLTASATNATHYLWNFGDNHSATAADHETTYQYQDTGLMHIVVTPLFNGCPGVKDSFDIYIKGVVANFVRSNTCDNKNTFTFTTIPHGTVSHFEWTFSNTPGFIDSVNLNPTHTFPPVGPSTVQLILLDRISGCADTTSTGIYTAQPVFTASAQSVCRDSSMTFTVSNSYPPGFVMYGFHVNGQVVDNDADSILIHQAVNHGTYNNYVVLYDGIPSTCDDTLYLPTPIRVKGPVTTFTANPDRACRNIPISFTNNSHPFFPQDLITSWNWDFWDGTVSSVQSPPPHLYASAGTFLVNLTATDVSGCKLKYQVPVQIDPIPEITVYPRYDTICMTKDTATLSAYTIDNFVWIPATNISCNNCDTIKAYPPSSTYYVAQATNPGGCKNSDTSFIKVFGPFNLNVSPADTGVCPRIPVKFRMDTTGVTTWSPAKYLNDSTIRNPIAIADTSVTYTVIVTDSVGCYADTAQVKLNIYPIPTVDAGPDKILNYNDPFMINAQYSSNVSSYSWSPPLNLDCTTCPQPTGTALETQEYTVKVRSIKGCSASDNVKISLACVNSNLYMPSAFTPGNDATNNYFYPTARGFKMIKSFVIYNRYGNKVFERQNFMPNIASLGWDGSIKGDASHTNTQAFVWYMEAVCGQGDLITSKGTVVLIR